MTALRRSLLAAPLTVLFIAIITHAHRTSPTAGPGRPAKGRPARRSPSMLAAASGLTREKPSRPPNAAGDPGGHSFEETPPPGNFATAPEISRAIAHLLKMVGVAYDQRRFERCIRCCEIILLIDTRYVYAMNLILKLEEARRRRDRYDALGESIESLKRRTDDGEDPVLPEPHSVELMDREYLSDVCSRVRYIEHPNDEDGGIIAINRKMAALKIDLAFENTPLEDILAFIRDFSGLNIVFDADGYTGTEASMPVTLHVKDFVLKDLLQILLSAIGKDYEVTEEEVVLITDPGRTVRR